MVSMKSIFRITTPVLCVVGVIIILPITLSAEHGQMPEWPDHLKHPAMTHGTHVTSQDMDDNFTSSAAQSKAMVENCIECNGNEYSTARSSQTVLLSHLEDLNAKRGFLSTNECEHPNNGNVHFDCQHILLPANHVSVDLAVEPLGSNSDPTSNSLPQDGSTQSNHHLSEIDREVISNVNYTEHSMKTVDENINPENIEYLQVDSLLTRQSEISESILLLERQILQAELIGRLMEVMGPETPIEIAPGRFGTFAHTPKGRSIANNIAANEHQANVELLNLRTDIANAEMRLDQSLNGIRGVDGTTVSLPPELTHTPIPELILWEIHGHGGHFDAIIQIDDRTIRIKEGSEIAGFGNVKSIDQNSIKIVKNDNIHIVSIDD